MAQQDYREIAAIAQQRRAAALPKQYLLPEHILNGLSRDYTSVLRHSNHFTEAELAIVLAEAPEILSNTRRGTWSSVSVVEAFCKAATVAQQLTNCVSEILFVEAIARAQGLDAHLARTGQPVGPLHGLPISLKDCLITPPHPSSIGMSYYANTPTTPEQETLIVSMIRELGGIAYVKTNTPVAMMMMETQNHVFGETINPHNSLLSAGGSSGGEGALLAMCGSPLGIGTDVGGSIRIPAAFCGLYGLKPSYGRYPQLGGRSGIPGQEFILATNGPMARSLETLHLYSSAILSAASAPWARDPKCVPIPWRTEPQIVPQGRKLRLAMIGRDDGVVTVHPPVERALVATRTALERAGHTVVDWPTDQHLEMMKMVLAAFFNYGGPAILPLLEAHDEPIFPSMNGYAAAASASAAAAAGAAAAHTANGTTPADPSAATGLTPNAVRAANIDRNALMKTHLDAFHALRLDGIIAPVSPWAACRRNVTNDKTGYVGHTSWVNLLDLPACTFPVLKAGGEPARKDGEWVPRGDVDAVVQADYDPETYEGAPVCLQLVGERLGEEKVLEVVGVLRRVLDAAGVERRWSGSVSASIV